jgi:hypothetical protein
LERQADKDHAVAINPLDNLSVSIRGASTGARASSSSFITSQVLRELGNKPGVLDTQAMSRMGLQDSFRNFDVTDVSPADLGMVSKNLYALGLIDKTTANLLVSAGTSLDATGNQTRPNVRINALDYFASRIDNLRSANVNGNEYTFHVVPDYIKAVYVLQNLDDFAKEGQRASNALSSVRNQVGNVHVSRPGINTWA